MNRLEKLHTRIVRKESISTKDNGYFSDNNVDPYRELSDWVIAFMKKYKIGKFIQPSVWGTQKVNEIQNIIRKKMLTHTDGQVEPKSVNPLKLYDDLQDEVKNSKDFSDYDFARVARTETARIKSVYALHEFKEAGFKYVIHRTKNDNRVSAICKSINGVEFKIDDLLRENDIDSKRIPIHPQCRCRYEASNKGI
jgi:SPP1 gp7 family putative phage head morphogenesis protein